MILDFDTYNALKVEALVRHGGASTPDHHAVGGPVAEVGCDTIFQPVARSQQDNQHEDTPRHSKAGQEAPQLVLLHGEQNFGQGVKLEKPHGERWFAG